MYTWSGFVANARSQYRNLRVFTEPGLETKHGENTIALSGLGPGLHTLTFTSGELASTHDDFNITGMRISY